MCLAIPGQVVELTDTEKHLARVDVAGIHRVVNVALLQAPESTAPDGPGTADLPRQETSPPEGGVQPGDWVLIHVGFAISRIDEEEARRTYEFLQELGADFEEELEDFSESEIA